MKIIFSMVDGKQYTVDAQHVELRYDLLRTIPSGDVIAVLAHGQWELTEYATQHDGLKSATAGDLVMTINIVG